MLCSSFDQALWPLRPAFKPPCKPLKCFAAALTRHSGHRHLLLERSSLPFASIAICCWEFQACRLPAFKCLTNAPRLLRGSFDQSLWPQAFVVGAFKPAVCLQRHLVVRAFKPAVCQPSNASTAPQQRRPAFKPPKSFAATSTSHSGHRQLLLEHSSLPFASRAINHLLLGRSSLPFASLQMPQMLRGSFDQPSNPQNASRQLRPAGHRHLLLERSRLPFASKTICCYGVQACRLPAFKCLKCSAAASTSLQTPKMLHGSFDQALWPQAYVVRAIKPAVCLQSHLFLGRSSLPFASLQMPQMLRGSFDQPSNS